MSSFDPKGHLLEATRRVHRLLTNDLKALDADKCTTHPGEQARSALHIVAECAAVNGMIATLLTTGEFKRLPPEERDAYLNSFDTQEKAMDLLEQETNRLLAVIETLDVNTLGEMSEAIGRPMTRFAIAELPAMHMMYHDGQLNYIQTLFGDTQMHW